MDNHNSAFSIEPKKFIEITEQDLISNYPDALMRLYEEKLVGFIVKGFLKDSEVNGLAEKFNNLNDSVKTITQHGVFYPELFPEFNLRLHNTDPTVKEELTKKYFEGNLNFARKFKNEFGVDLHLRFTNFFESISGGRPVSPPKGLRDYGEYLFGSFRWFPPKDGSLTIHCGNYFQTLFRDVYQDLNQKAAVFNQLSFFISLQTAETGGELEVFGLNWQDGMTKTDMSTDNEVILADGSKLEPFDHPEISVVRNKPEPGDLVLFQGGSIWHRVSTVMGTQPRMTFGGFIAPDHNKESFLFWS